MTWVRIEDGMVEHPKIAGLSDPAFRAFVYGLCYCNRYLSDGFIPERIAHTSVAPGAKGKRIAGELVDADLWHPTKGGYDVHDFHVYQPTKAEVVALREKRAEAGRRGGLKSKPPSKREAKPEALASHFAEAKQEAKRNPGSQSRLTTPKPSLDQSLVVAPELAASIDHQIRNGSNLTEATQAAILDLVKQLPDATDGTVGRLVKLAKRGAGPAAFHDARQGVAETKPRHPSRVACRIIEQRLEGSP